MKRWIFKKGTAGDSVPGPGQACGPAPTARPAVCVRVRSAAILVTLFCFESLATASHKASGFVRQFGETAKQKSLRSVVSREVPGSLGEDAPVILAMRRPYASAWHQSKAVLQSLGEFAEGQGERKIESILY